MVQRLVAEEIETVVEDQLETEFWQLWHWPCACCDELMIFMAKVQGELQDHQTVRGK